MKPSAMFGQVGSGFEWSAMDVGELGLPVLAERGGPFTFALLYDLTFSCQMFSSSVAFAGVTR